ncbi:AraC-like ligand binding domain-containing protein [Actinopolymorpha cephalotaxi]|uniref:AraC-like DNA-binding protein n=1 Tax=Actinopolymorpha cephalotaxi TaxID=504797 RepID=A0A1I2KSA2_9ACTN|nr:helix-turn-helix transcriptional regulator [Actinopolymorpha cephalotaxi]NYH84598.1 AraC-like DNA-binding protein [Actinopolymorpha cephalotaxi]SFF69159.1 AraC-like ligand binding domain-containing protein [Actinopolymorpha cephalotaxi]
MAQHASQPILILRTGPEIAEYPPRTTFGPRTLVDFEFVWLLRGSAHWQCGEHRIDLHPGTLLLARPGMRDHFRWDPEHPSAHAYAHFGVADAGSLGDPEGWPLTRALSPADPMAALCGYALWLAGGAPNPDLARTAEVLGWLLDLFVRGPVPDGVAADAGLSPHLRRLADSVAAAWRDDGTRPLSLGELAAATGVSPGHLSRLFRAEYSVGPVAAMELVRLARAATLLQRSNLTVAAVANACGFSSPFHFSRRFRTVYGIPPRTYRTAHATDDPHEPLARAGLLRLARRLLADHT